MWMRLALLVVMAILLVAAAPSPLAAADCAPTRPDALGPFYVAGAPERSQTGEGLVITGAVKSVRECRPLRGAQLEWWSANPRGDYDDAHRATQAADGEGRYRYVTNVPGKYPGRPVHVHVRITAPGHKPLVTQVYPKPNQGSISFDITLQPE